MTRDSDEAVARIREALEGYAEGVHVVGQPAAALDADLPAGVTAVWRSMDGAELFHGELVLLARAAWVRKEAKVRVGEMGEDSIWADLASGTVWREEEETGEWIQEGSSFERWLWGWIEAEGELYDRDGEYVDGVIDEEGELTDVAAMERERRLLKRDRAAPAPRWRLARALQRQGQREAARDELEQVVEHCPGFGWAWYDLARVSESLGEIAGARDEALAAAEADPAYEHAAFFLGWAARLASLAGDEVARAELAARALAADADLPRRQIEGARASLDAGEVDAARELCQVALALAPRDLAALDLRDRIAGATPED